MGPTRSAPVSSPLTSITAISLPSLFLPSGFPPPRCLPPGLFVRPGLFGPPGWPDLDAAIGRDAQVQAGQAGVLWVDAGSGAHVELPQVRPAGQDSGIHLQVALHQRLAL